ncbi:hypothetical protein RKD18_000208 [Streptomyces phaeoluteigriseus]
MRRGAFAAYGVRAGDSAKPAMNSGSLIAFCCGLSMAANLW